MTAKRPRDRPRGPGRGAHFLVLEEEAQVLLRELAERGGVASDSAFEDEPLLVLQPQDALLDSVAYDEAHRADRLVLADAVGAVDGLHA